MHKASVYLWEKGLHEPQVEHYGAVVRFLGHDPRPEPQTLGERIKRRRKGEGLSQEELARKLGVDPSTVTAWERDEVRKPYPRFVRLFEAYVKGE